MIDSEKPNIPGITARRFEMPSLEMAGAAAFVLLFAWVVVALRLRTGAVKSGLSPRSDSSISRDPTVPQQES